MTLIAGYHQRGWRLVLIPPGQKGPRDRGWQDAGPGLDEAERHIAAGGNVGVILGARSGELVDIDIDCQEALDLADIYLPPSGGVFGRRSKPRSHRLYVAPNARHAAYRDPFTGDTLVELRADGPDGGAHQTVFPPSIHPSGERIEWAGATIAPVGFHPAGLRVCVALLAIGALSARYVSRHAAEHPGPDLPRLLFEADRDLGRAAYHWLNKPAPGEPGHGLRARPRRDLSAAEIDLAELVAAIPNNTDWEGWNAIGLAIFAASGGSDQGGIAFDDWSAKSPRYNPYTTAERWRHFRRSPPSRTGLGKLIKLARDNGWRPTARREAGR